MHILCSINGKTTLPTVSANPLFGRRAVSVGCLFALLVAGLASALAGPVPPHTNTPRTYAEPPLPIGVVARVGSGLFRQQDYIRAMCYSPDGRQIGAVGADTFCVWGAETGRSRFIVTRPGSEFLNVTFLARERAWLVVVKLDKSEQTDVCRFNEWGACIAKAPMRSSAKNEKSPYRVHERVAELRPDAARLVVVTHQKQFEVFDTQSGASLWSGQLPGFCGRAFGFSPDGKELAVATEDEVTLYDMAGKKTAALQVPHKTGWCRLAYSPDGARVVASGYGHSHLVAWDRATGKALWSKPNYGDEVAFTPDGRRVLHVKLFSGDRSTLFSLDPATGADQKGIGAGLRVDCFTFRPDRARLAVATIGGTIVQFDAVTWQIVAPSADPPGIFGRIRFSPDGKMLFACVENCVEDWVGWDVRTGRRSWSAPPGTGAAYCFSADGRWSARIVPTSGKDARLVIREVATDRQAHSFPVRLPRYGEIELQFTPDGQRIIGFSVEGARVWATDTGREVLHIQAPMDVLPLRAISADGQVLAACPTRTFVMVQEVLQNHAWSLRDGKHLLSFARQGVMTAVSLSADGHRIVTAENRPIDDDKQPANVTVRDTQTGQVVMVQRMRHPPDHIDISPDGRMLAIAVENDIVVYEVVTGGRRFSYGHKTPINGLVFSPDGRALAASSLEAPVYLWDTTGDLTDPPAPWGPESAERVWADLAGATGPGWRAVRQLRANPTPALALLRGRLGQQKPEPSLLCHQFTQLSAADFRTREQATEALQGYGDLIRAELTAEASRAASPEARARLARLVAHMDSMTPDRVRVIRAVEAVEGMGTADAVVLLRDWARGPAGRLLTDEAQGALDRFPGR